MFFDLIWCITGFTLKQLLVGASTSICAVMGLFIAQVIVLHKMGESAKKGKCIAGVLIVSLTLVSLQPHVSLLAHLGGLLSGLFFGLMVLPGSQQEALDSQQEAVKKLKTMGTMIFIGFSVILFGIWLWPMLICRYLFWEISELAKDSENQWWIVSIRQSLRMFGWNQQSITSCSVTYFSQSYLYPCNKYRYFLLDLKDNWLFKYYSSTTF